MPPLPNAIPHTPGTVTGSRPWNAQPAVEVELVDVATDGGVVAVHRRAPRVGDEDVAAERRDPEGGVPGRDRRIDERAAADDAPPAGVEDEHAVVVEVGRVEPSAGQCESAEDR